MILVEDLEDVEDGEDGEEINTGEYGMLLYLGLEELTHQVWTASPHNIVMLRILRFVLSLETDGKYPKLVIHSIKAL